MFLQDPEDAPSVLTVLVVPQDVSGLKGPQAERKDSWKLICAVWKTDVKNLQDVFCLTDRKPVPVNFFLCPMNIPSVLFHQYCSKLYFTL